MDPSRLLWFARGQRAIKGTGGFLYALATKEDLSPGTPDSDHRPSQSPSRATSRQSGTSEHGAAKDKRFVWPYGQEIQISELPYPKHRIPFIGTRDREDVASRVRASNATLAPAEAAWIRLYGADPLGLSCPSEGQPDEQFGLISLCPGASGIGIRRPMGVSDDRANLQPPKLRFNT